MYTRLKTKVKAPSLESPTTYFLLQEGTKDRRGEGNDCLEGKIGDLQDKLAHSLLGKRKAGGKEVPKKKGADDHRGKKGYRGREGR